jgi:hypothetical protein
MLACDVTTVLCLVQASSDGVDVKLFDREHFIVDHESDFGWEIEQRSSWLCFRFAELLRVFRAESECALFGLE